ncbi:hypothetical protein UVI_02042750 [Ustilaginoidea virens]|uniref:polynucleotide adenylyltransferase n=1 Tax=Ustilaginoidea virens TaxID=1159556 RepID=A0A1B5L691_USTVR|nr:hypothetical protein UVI_02042750 [Ustilaginoidea virens]
MVRNKPKHRDDGNRAQNPRHGPDSRRAYPPTSSPPRRSQRLQSLRPDNGGRDARDDGHRHYARRIDAQGAIDSYRPQVPQGNFTFRFDKPAGIKDLPREPSRFDHRSSQRDRRGPARNSGRRWQPPPHPSERALISGATLNLPEERLDDGEGKAKFRDLDELSDDDELDMDISSASDSEEPSRKRARTQKTGQDGETLPKWSNPDPYTALPCPDESTQKKRDVVKLIRKARLEAIAKPTAPAEAEDFISFDLTDDEQDDKESQEDILPPPPTEPPPPPPPPHAPPSRPAAPSVSRGVFGYSREIGLSAADQTGPLGSRKRTADDEIKPPDYGELKKATTRPSKGSITSAWLPKANEDPCPWQIEDHSSTHNMAFRLHKEIMDFYEYVRPRDFEQRIRDNLVENLRKAMRREGRDFASAQVHPFGSFMSGLYLPTADMDLVVCSASYMRGGPPTYLSAKSWLYKFKKFLMMQHVAESSSISVIAHARIPLVKFVDKLTGLKVDVSFENLGGVTAIDTFLSWKKLYPSMPILVTVIKHFLLMRGLNEPVNGGIGGFSVICLVISMLQLMPHVQSRSLIPEHHLGEMLLEFFELYGRQFEYETNAISLARPTGYIRKATAVLIWVRRRGGGLGQTDGILGGNSHGAAFATLVEKTKPVGMYPGAEMSWRLHVVGSAKGPLG